MRIVLWATAGLVLSVLFALFQVAAGAALLVGGLLGLVDAYRRRVKLLGVYMAFWGAFYVGGHVLIAAVDPTWLSPVAAVWTLFFVGITPLGLWIRGGVSLDITLVVTSASDASFDKFQVWLDEQTEIPGLSIPVGLFRALLPVWRNLGQSFFDFFKKAEMVALLVGMYFMLFPPSNSWRMFWLTAVAFVAYTLTGIEFNWPFWRKVSIAIMAFATVGSVLTLQISALRTMDPETAFLIVMGALAVAICVLFIFGDSFNKDSTTKTVQSSTGGAHHGAH